MDQFLQQADQVPQHPAQPFVMEQMRRELENLQTAPARAGSPAWAAEFDAGEHARMEVAFQGPKAGMLKGSGFSPAEFASIQQQNRNVQRSSSPVTSAAPMMNAYRPQIGMGYQGMGPGYMGMMGPSFGPMTMQQQPVQEDKGKGRMVELDDQNWEAQFAEIDAAGQNALDEEANAAIETELNDLDRSVPNETDEFGDFESIWRGIQAETAANRRIVNEEIDFDTVH